MGRKVWNISTYDKNAASALALKAGVDDFAVLLLQSRGIRTADAVLKFVFAADTELSSPFLIKDMERAAERINRAVEDGEKILVYGDYDADGVTATALLTSYLETVGADVSYRIPSRLKEGYGLSPETAEEICKTDIKLVITVDNGIASIKEAEIFKANGIDFIVTDHHKVGEVLPAAYAVVDPHREDDTSPEENLAGVGVALKLISALEGGDCEAIFEEFGDLAAIGTIADIVPLTGENRIIVARGLALVRNSCRPGIIKLLESAGIKGDVSGASVAFGIAPRINAAGRMGSAETALRLLLTEDEDEATELAEILVSENVKRQATESIIAGEIEAYLEENPCIRNDRVIVVSGKDWHSGVIGIAASRLVEKYGRPAIVISVGEDGVSRGSCRSIDGFSLYEALSFCEDTLIQFGGHTLAAGFSVQADKIDAFRKKINRYAAALPPFYPSLNIDVRLNPGAIGTDILESLSYLEPFGAENPAPYFGIFGATVQNVKSIGSDKHTMLTLTKDNVSFRTVYFGQTADTFPYKAGDAVDVAVKIEKNEFRGEVKPGIQLKDIRPAGENDLEMFFSLSVYNKFLREEELSCDEKALICPDRAMLGNVYRFLKERKRWHFSPEILCMRTGLSYEKAGAVAVCLDVLASVGILTRNGTEFSLSDFTGKANLADCRILKKLEYRE